MPYNRHAIFVAAQSLVHFSINFLATCEKTENIRKRIKKSQSNIHDYGTCITKLMKSVMS